VKAALALINAHLLPALVVACIAGIAGSSWVPLSPAAVLGVALSAASLLFISCLRCRQDLALPAALLLFFLAGLHMGTSSSQTPAEPHHIFNLIDEPRDVVVVGRLLAMPQFDGATSRVKIDLESVRLGAAEPHIPAIGTILLRLAGPWPQRYKPGSLLAVRTTLQRPTGYAVPGIFDYPAELARQDIWITGFCRSPALIHGIEEQTSFLARTRFLPERLRAAIGAFLDSHTAPPAGGLYRAILLGDRSRIPDDLLERFKLSGTMHVLAISGVHMTIITVLLFGLIYWLLRRSVRLILSFNLKKLAGLICLPLLFGYTLLAGSNIPVIRACLMSVLLILAFCGNRSKSASSLIAFGALSLLALSPQTLFTASFQLSFAAFISIALLLPVLRQLQPEHPHPTDNRSLPGMLRRLRGWLLCGLLVSSAAVLGTAPITIYHFHRFPLAGPLANLVMEPLICLWALPFGFFSLSFIAVAPDLAAQLLSIGGIGFDLAIRIAGLLQSAAWTNLWLPGASAMTTVGYYCTLFLLLRRWASPGSIVGKILLSLPFAVFLFLLFSPPSRTTGDDKQAMALHFLDVGQGSATLIRFADHSHMLIDGGASSYNSESPGQRLIAPFLWNAGITRLETIVLTHPDADHTNGIPFLIEHFSPNRLYVNTLDGGNEQFRQLLVLAAKSGVEIHEAGPGNTLHDGPGRVTCLANTSRSGYAREERNTGIVLSVQLAGTSILFPGDIDSETEKQLLAAGVPTQSKILLAAHHGSSTSNSPEFLQQVDPQVVMVSAGRSRGALFPSDQLRDYCRSPSQPAQGQSG